jgi:hypothetical protein
MPCDSSEPRGPSGTGFPGSRGATANASHAAPVNSAANAERATSGLTASPPPSLTRATVWRVSRRTRHAANRDRGAPRSTLRHSLRFPIVTQRLSYPSGARSGTSAVPAPNTYRGFDAPTNRATCAASAAVRGAEIASMSNLRGASDTSPSTGARASLPADIARFSASRSCGFGTQYATTSQYPRSAYPTSPRLKSKTFIVTPSESLCGHGTSRYSSICMDIMSFKYCSGATDSVAGCALGRGRLVHRRVWSSRRTR